jgi:hypothetical protein
MEPPKKPYHIEAIEDLRDNYTSPGFGPRSVNAVLSLLRS